MDIRYTACLFLLPLLAQAQPDLPGFFPGDTASTSCLNDTNVRVLNYQAWEAYQTTDDHWWGPRDSSVCIALAHTSGLWAPYIELDQVHADRPVFIRWRATDDTAIPLTPDNEYAIDMSVYSTGALDGSFTCPDGACTGILAAVRIPDSTDTGYDRRWYQAGYGTSSLGNADLHLCVPTEHFAENALRELIISVKATDPVPGQRIDLTSPFSVDLQMNGTLQPLTAATLPQYQSGPAEYDLYGWNFNYLVMYPDATYPSEEHEGYVDVSPLPNTSVPEEVTLTLGAFTGLNFQPFTELRGGLVEGSDSVRHTLHVVNEGADICMTWQIIDLWWGPGDTYTHKSGHIEMGGENSCLLFGWGSTLELAEGSTLHLGQRGRGILGLVGGSTVRLGRRSELVIHGIMSLKDRPGTTETEDMPLVLRDGAKLTFAPGCKVDNSISMDQRMRLHVVLDGGSVDLSGLSAEDRWKVYVTDLPKEAMASALLLGNPIGDALSVDVAVREAGELTLRAFDAVGRCVADRQVTLSAGHNVLDLPATNWRSGTYLLELRKGDQRQVLRFVKP